MYQIIQAIWKVDKLDIDKLVPVLVNLSKLSDIVKNDLLKIQNIEDQIPEITNLATNASLNAKINNVKGGISGSPNLVTTAGLTAVEYKTPNVSNLVEKWKNHIKITEIENKIATDHDHDKYISTQNFNKLLPEDFTARLIQANLASKKHCKKYRFW